jgi:hypothetical protein
MSARISLQTIILAHRLSEQLKLENKGDLHKMLLEKALLGTIERQEVTPAQMIDAEHMCRIVANAYFHLQSRIRHRCEKQGDLFRPQMMIPIAPGILTRFGTGGFAAAVGYQKETTKKIKGATKILERASLVSEHCNTLITHLVQHSKWDIARVETEILGYQWKQDDDEPFAIDGADWEQDEDDDA